MLSVLDLSTTNMNVQGGKYLADALEQNKVMEPSIFYNSTLNVDIFQRRLPHLTFTVIK